MCDAKVSDEKLLIRRANECIIVSLATTTVPNLPKLLRYTPGTCIPNVSKFDGVWIRTAEVHFLPFHQYPS
jgi:hypothetical protein